MKFNLDSICCNLNTISTEKWKVEKRWIDDGDHRADWYFTIEFFTIDEILKFLNEFGNLIFEMGGHNELPKIIIYDGYYE